MVTSYRQTVRAYPAGGGSYIVARENLGTVPGLVAAAAILTDYVLTVAVSITAGTTAIASVAPEALVPIRVPIAIGLVMLVTLANLRGVKEAGSLFAIPTYGFVLMIAITLVTGFIECLGGCPVADTADLPLEVEHTLSLFLIARAFSSGATALTGVEAIADGVPAFRRPQAKNAATTLAVMGGMSVAMFLGITALSQMLQVRITEDVAHELPVLAQIGDTVFGGGFMYLLLQVFTAGILILAANTAFQDFPRLASILARDRFMPSQFRNRGDRLVFSNGVVVLAALASLLIWAFDANLTRLIQLYVVGVFTAFTLSQAGMVRRWLRTREDKWQRSAVINGIGALHHRRGPRRGDDHEVRQGRLDRDRRDALHRAVLLGRAPPLRARGARAAGAAAHGARRGLRHDAAARARRRPRDPRGRRLPAGSASRDVLGAVHRSAGLVRAGRRRLASRGPAHGRASRCSTGPTAISCGPCAGTSARCPGTSGIGSSPW